MNMRNMKVLVTGVAGFIGSNLAERLLAEGHAVVGVDNMSQGDKLNIAPFAHNDAFKMHYMDIRDEQAMLRVADGCDSIVHLAAFKIPRYSDALDTLLVNSVGSESVIRAALANRCRIVAASTSDVYGKNPEVPFLESSDLVVGRPEIRRWAYAISKMFEEQLLFAYRDRFGVEFVVLRFFGGYGPNQNLTWWGGPQSVFINNALDNEEIELHGDGQQTRSFTYITDHVEGIVGALKSERAMNQVLNLGYAKEISIEGLARLIWKMIRGDERPKLKLVPYSKFGLYEDVRRRVPGTDKARELLDFEARVGLEDGLKKTIRWQIGRRLAHGTPTTVPSHWQQGG
jgi:UDP-glucose 4-epimerase